MPLSKQISLYALVTLALTGHFLSSTVFARQDETEKAGRLQWFTDFDRALEESRQTGKPVLMEINGRPWCPPCNQQGEQIIEQPEFQEWARENVVLLDIKVGKGYDKQQGNPDWSTLLKRYELPGIPAAVLLDQDGNKLNVILPKPNVQQWLGAASNAITNHNIAASTGKFNHIIPFRLTRWNNLSVPVTLNGSIALNLMFHTAVGEVSLTRDTVERFPEITLDQQARARSWGGTAESRFGSGHTLSVAGMKPQSVTIFEDLHSGHGTDGKFGPAQLNAQRIAINFDRSEIQTLAKLPEDLSGWQKVEFEVDKGMMFIKAKIHGQQDTVTQRFMIHSGYSGYALLDNAFVGEHPFLNQLDVLQESELTDSAGNKLSTRMVQVPKFELAGMTEADVPMSFFEGQIGGQSYSLLGGDFLKRFNLIIDFESKQMYLKKSRFHGDEFFISKKLP